MALTISNDHKLAGDGTEYKNTPRQGDLKAGMPDTIVIHYTAGASAESSVRELTKEGGKTSAHIVVGRDGKIFQLAPFNKKTWHAGTSKHLNRRHINQYSIGIEIDNAGPLTLENGEFKTWFKRTVDPKYAYKGIHRNQSRESFWHTYTEEQIRKVEELCQLLIDKYGIKYIVGHEEISPDRKVDPGPAFPLDSLRDRLLSNRSDESEIVGKKGNVTADFLNIRSGPSAKNEKVAKPLLENSEVKVLDESNGWYQVETKITGWVSKNHVLLK